MEELLAHKSLKKSNISLQDVQYIVANNIKKRFELKQENDVWYIRAV